MKLEAQFEKSILNEYFSGMVFVDQREKEVFLSYLKGFSILFFDTTVNNIVEIGGGQSTAIFSMMAERLNYKVNVIDMNPEAIKNKVKNKNICENIFKHVDFHRGVSISRSDLERYYDQNLESIGGVMLQKVIENSVEFINIITDGRKEASVLRALGMDNLNVVDLQKNLIKEGMFPKSLLNIYRNKNDEFDFLPTTETSNSLLSEILDHSDVDVVFLDSGEFSSLPEWEIVSKRLRVGGYVILHDIFFPKSFKNWLVCASITASSDWNTIYLDRSVPQGLMLARKVR